MFRGLYQQVNEARVLSLKETVWNQKKRGNGFWNLNKLLPHPGKPDKPGVTLGVPPGFSCYGVIGSAGVDRRAQYRISPAHHYFEPTVRDILISPFKGE